ncbi:hypothetical protein AJ79_03634 [Helicocarpus griseus UAMH5409]|uniref:AMP-dependent synthetase/ligase domain-containing protein n=1 Tax=Helicocarpus griseus UAMH5409 TaxID=1447875 RepID=A0A2B7XP07_9EURO|nr:hypothetical protein AJ79_03634 [Helicocarpus griseus UAMH5409]
MQIRQLLSYLDQSPTWTLSAGSTGRPKGVYLNHYRMEGYNAYVSVVSESKIFLSSAVVFDMCLPAVYGTIQYGAGMFVASREALLTTRISSCIFTPTQAKILLSAHNKAKLQQWKDIDSFVLGGESIPPWIKRLAQGHGAVLGGPFFPARFHIVDKKMRTVPFGIPGELYIAEPNVSGEYVNRPDVSARAFSKDPLAPATEIELGYGNLYRTGDSFRLNRDGTVEILGRIASDRQVKIRGMRTEFEEIKNGIWDSYEAVEIEDTPKLSLTAVVYHRTGKSDGILTAYLDPADGVTVSEEEQQKFAGYLRLSLEAILPPHMLPAAYVSVEDVPRTISGKVDYKSMASWPGPAVVSGNVKTADNKPLRELQGMAQH